MILAQKNYRGESLQYADSSFWGGMGTTSYKILLVVHILAVIAAFGPTLVYATLYRIKAVDSAQKVNMRISIPALAVATFAGILLVLDSDGVAHFDESWISVAFVLVLVVFLLQWFVLRPAQGRLAKAFEQAESSHAEASEADLRGARANAAVATALIHITLVAAIIVMIWQPGK